MIQHEPRQVLYVSSLITEEEFAKYLGEGRAVPSIAAQKFHRLLAEGLSRDPRISAVKAVSAAPVSRRMTKKLLFGIHHSVRGGVKYTVMPFVNFPVFRQMSIAVSTFVTIIRAVRSGQSAIVCDVLCGGPSIGALLAGRVTRTPVLGIVTDVPQYRPAVGNCARRMKNRVINLLGRAWITHFDAYLLLTDAMDTVVNPRHKPRMVMEGLVDALEIASDAAPRVKDAESRIVLYTGSTHKVYGLRTLAQAFLDANPAGWELHICGQGDMDEELRAMAAVEDSLFFHGVVANREAVEMQKRASLLVNPRPTHEEFTKFSFPSKNMEYMVSGTPVLTTALPGMPAEYKSYVYIVHHETRDGFREALNELTSYSVEELEERGIRARAFVLQQKNNTVQAARLVDLLAALWTESAPRATCCSSFTSHSSGGHAQSGEPAQ